MKALICTTPGGFAWVNAERPVLREGHEGLSYDELALVEPLAIGAHGVRRAGKHSVSAIPNSTSVNLR